MSLVFVTGPVRSGKSRFAERLALERGGPVTYVATGRVDAEDAEWCARIAHHRQRRPANWVTVETARVGAPPFETVLAETAAEQTLLIDSFGTWVASMMDPACEPEALEARVIGGVDAILHTAAHAIVVGEETGWGIVPDYPAGRLFRDVVGRAQQRLAVKAEGAYLVVAGFAIDLQRIGSVVRDSGGEA